MNPEEQRAQQTLVDQKDALSVYLKALLREDEEFNAPASVAETVVAESPAPADTEAPLSDITESPVGLSPKPAPVVEEPTEQVGDVRPAWGRQRFQAMLFKVGGLTLAVPLSELHGIREWNADSVTPMPGRARVSWYLGLTGYRGRQVPVVDTAELVLPAERRSNLVGEPEERISRIVFIGDGSWGLGCDQVNEVISLEPDEVRWRTERTKRRWLAGTVIQHMCALLDPGIFAQMLAVGAKDMALGPEEQGGNAKASS